MFRRITDVAPKFILDEVLRLAKVSKDWVQWKSCPEDGPGRYRTEITRPTWLRGLYKQGQDIFHGWALSHWLVDGPKVFRPTLEQCHALEQIEVRLELSDYAQPYPAILIDMPEDYAPFWSILCFHYAGILICCLATEGNKEDIVTTISVDGRPIEVSLQKYDADCKVHAPIAARALRVAVNSCLALVNYGCHFSALYPHEERSDLSLAREKDTERGKRARGRLQTALQLVTFSQEVVLHRVQKHEREEGEPTGLEMPPHWRRGHWAMQPHGPQNSLRKRILRPPVLVRSDKFMGDKNDTTTSYH